MEYRMLSELERRSLTPDAVQFVYRLLYVYRVPCAILERALLEAVLLGRMRSAPVDLAALEGLVDRAFDSKAPGATLPRRGAGDASSSWTC